MLRALVLFSSSLCVGFMLGAAWRGIFARSSEFGSGDCRGLRSHALSGGTGTSDTSSCPGLGTEDAGAAGAAAEDPRPPPSPSTRKLH
jgi:hypothetical protein